MRSLLHQLENNEAVLLMYLAGELPAEDRAEVEQLLSVDAGLRRELDSLRTAETFMTLAMSTADGFAMPAVTEAARQSAAVRRVSRAMVRSRLEREHESVLPEVQTPTRTFRLPGWTYPFAAAAAIVFAWVGYWGFSNTGSGPQKMYVDDVPSLPQIDGSDDGSSFPLASGPGSEDPARRSVASLPSLGVEEGDRDLLAISAGSYDVSSLFQPEPQ
jgi:hypothetical protein